jgi:hypothetical protein
MQFGRITRKFLAWVLTAALVFSQLAVAAHACPMDGQTAVASVATVVAATSGCDEMDGMSTVCERHCHDAAKDQPQSDLPLAQPTFTVALHAYDVPLAPRGLPHEPALQRAISPSLNLSHCVFRI